MSSLSFVQRTFCWDEGNGLSGEKGVGLGHNFLQENVLSSPDFKNNTELLWHIGFDPYF